MALTKEDIEVIKTLAAEMRKPTEVEQKQIDADEQAKKFAQQERKENAEAVRRQTELDRRMKLSCTHAHADGHTHLAQVIESGTLAGGAGYLHCQLCNGRIRPENPQIEKLDPQAIYDTALFNRLYQTLPNRELFG